MNTDIREAVVNIQNATRELLKLELFDGTATLRDIKRLSAACDSLNHVITMWLSEFDEVCR